MTTYIIETQELTKQYHNIIALNSLNMHVRKGIHGFIGPNGAGKTTTIKILLNIITPTSGNAYIFGLDSQEDSYEIRKRVGVLLEKFNIPNDMTIYDFLSFVARLYNISIIEINHKIHSLLSTLDLIEYINRPFGALSAGMKRKLGIAAALISNPELIILDEPTANIDPESRIKIREVILEVHRNLGTSFFISSHILTELERICKRYSIIYNGKIIGESSLEELGSNLTANTYQIQASNYNKLIDFLSTKSYVRDLYTDELTVTVCVTDVDLFQFDLFSFLTKEKIKLKMFHSIEDNLEEVFKKLISRESNE